MSTIHIVVDGFGAQVPSQVMGKCLMHTLKTLDEMHPYDMVDIGVFVGDQLQQLRKEGREALTYTEGMICLIEPEWDQLWQSVVQHSPGVHWPTYYSHRKQGAHQSIFAAEWQVDSRYMNVNKTGITLMPDMLFMVCGEVPTKMPKYMHFDKPTEVHFLVMNSDILRGTCGGLDHFMRVCKGDIVYLPSPAVIEKDPVPLIQSLRKKVPPTPSSLHLGHIMSVGSLVPSPRRCKEYIEMATQYDLPLPFPSTLSILSFTTSSTLGPYPTLARLVFVPETTFRQLLPSSILARMQVDHQRSMMEGRQYNRVFPTILANTLASQDVIGFVKIGEESKLRGVIRSMHRMEDMENVANTLFLDIIHPDVVFHDIEPEPDVEYGPVQSLLKDFPVRFYAGSSVVSDFDMSNVDDAFAKELLKKLKKYVMYLPASKAEVEGIIASLRLYGPQAQDQLIAAIQEMVDMLEEGTEAKYELRGYIRSMEGVEEEEEEEVYSEPELEEEEMSFESSLESEEDMPVILDDDSLEESMEEW